MPLLVFAYLALGFAVQCVLLDAQADWTELDPWLHILLWPGVLADLLAGGIGVHLAGIPRLQLLACALLLTAACGTWLARRLGRGQRGRLQVGDPAGTAAAVTISGRSRIEPRLSPPVAQRIEPPNS